MTNLVPKQFFSTRWLKRSLLPYNRKMSRMAKSCINCFKHSRLFCFGCLIFMDWQLSVKTAKIGPNENFSLYDTTNTYPPSNYVFFLFFIFTRESLARGYHLMSAFIFTDCLCIFSAVSRVPWAPSIYGQALHRPVVCNSTPRAVWQWGPERERLSQDHSSSDLRKISRSACSHQTTDQPHLPEVRQQQYIV